MKGKNIFTHAEIKQIECLIIQKAQAASGYPQRRIRDSIRDIGFYWEDFHPKGESPKVRYDVLNFRNLIAEGRVIISDVANKKQNESHSDKKVKTSIKRSFLQRFVNLFSTEKNTNLKNGLKPWVGNHPKVLILGSMPGDMSIERQMYYANVSHNSFWNIMYHLFSKSEQQSNKDFITSNGIALWDCVHSAVRTNSADSGFDDGTVIPNDLKSFLVENPSISTIIINGKGTPVKYFKRFFSDIEIDKIFVLNSTSNACAMTFQEKLKEWSVLKEILKK